MRELLPIALLIALVGACSITGDELEPVHVGAALDEAAAPEAGAAGAELELASTPGGDGGSAPDGAEGVSGEIAFASESTLACAAEERTPCGCGPCALGDRCVVDGDCADGDCVAGVCAEPSCDDDLANRDETDVDCGGASCGGCAVGGRCAGDGDCGEGLFCAPGDAGPTCRPPSCQDGFASGDEAAIDCGGDCPGCPEGTACTLASDCASGVCGAAGTCSAPSCEDGVANQGERDVDCGGPCDPCAAGQSCAEAGDCSSRVCGAVDCAVGASRCCQPPSCQDGAQNAEETDVDCGGAGCGGCPLGGSCTLDADCDGGACDAGVCVVLLVCGDGQQNGPESDVDCGGTEAGCPRCADLQTCFDASDCQSGRCDQGRCGSCFDGVQSGDEQGVDCGGSDPACAACIRCTDATSTDLGTTGTVTRLQADGCAKITQFPGYSPGLIEGYDQGPYPVPFSWRQECTGVSGSASFDFPYHQIQVGGLSIECPVFFELEGGALPFDIRWF